MRYLYFLYWFVSDRPVNKIKSAWEDAWQLSKNNNMQSQYLTWHLYKILILIMAEFLEDFVVIPINQTWRKYK